MLPGAACVPFELPIVDPVLQFTVLVTAALLVQLTVERLYLPGLTGLLLLGMLLGPGGLAVLPREPPDGAVIELLGDVGLIYVMFLAGLMIALVLAGKAAASWAAGALYGYSARARLVMTGLTVPQAAATLAVTTAARQAELFDETVMDAVIILIFVTCLAGPLLTRFAGRGMVEEGEREIG
jgi:Kef-type K+ transport system membrane component KefB